MQITLANIASDEEIIIDNYQVTICHWKSGFEYLYIILAGALLITACNRYKLWIKRNP
jgi:hypothetical protein